jgi:hypothetical protein
MFDLLHGSFPVQFKVFFSGKSDQHHSFKDSPEVAR